MGQFPVIPWHHFIDHVRCNVNPLAADDHMKEVIQQLQLMGEVMLLLTSLSGFKFYIPHDMDKFIMNVFNLNLGHLLERRQYCRYDRVRSQMAVWICLWIFVIPGISRHRETYRMLHNT